MTTTTKTNAKNPVLKDARQIVIKAALLFLLFNFGFALLAPQAFLGRLSLYNRLFPGRLRLPYGDNPQQSYNLSLYNLEAMLASHHLAGTPKAPDEFRVIFIGDSATWGYLLPPEDTLTAQINAANWTTADGRRVRAYNLGYPVMSLTKDLLLLQRAMAYEPDLLVWPLTLESFPQDKQLFPPLLQNNALAVRRLILTYNLNQDINDPVLQDENFWARSLIGQRRNLADLIRLQLYGIMWAATGIDHHIPPDFTPRMEDLPADLLFHELSPPDLRASDLAFDVLAAGAQLTGDTPLLVVNEPMFISQGENSDIRYNFFYPRWAYDDYRRLLADWTTAQNLPYLDLWDLVPGSEFTNSAVHMTAEGVALMAESVGQALVQIAAMEGQTTP